MAKAPKITVSVEQAVHKALADAIQGIYTNHGILVDRILIDWTGPAFMSDGSTRAGVHTVDISSRSIPMFPAVESNKRN